MRNRRYFSVIFLILVVGLASYVLFRYFSQLSPSLAALLIMTITSLAAILVLCQFRSENHSLNAQLLSTEHLDTLSKAAASVAHEIINPVSFIDSNLSALADDIEAYNEFIGTLDKASDYLDISNPFYQEVLKSYQTLDIANICDNAPVRIRESLEGIRRIENIVNDMGMLSQSNRMDMRIADINSELTPVFDSVRHSLPTSVTLATSLLNIPPLICNPSKIAHVVLNILTNARLAVNAGPGHISVKQRMSGDNVVIEISDDGCGMPPEVMHRIFEAFFTTRELGKGTGIGLALCYKLIREHNGDIEVQSQEGRGTTFTLTIPIQHGELINVE